MGEDMYAPTVAIHQKYLIYSFYSGNSVQPSGCPGQSISEPTNIQSYKERALFLMKQGLLYNKYTNNTNGTNNRNITNISVWLDEPLEQTNSLIKITQIIFHR
jgi:hypothetical protein